MYILILLKNGKRKEVARYDSPADFKQDNPTMEYQIVGRIIYIHEDPED